MCSPFTYSSHPIETIVEDLYHRCGVKTPGDITLYLWDTAVRIMAMHRHGDTNTAKIRDTHVIFIDGDKPLPVRRVEMAHEIGHVLLHCGDQEEMPPFYTAKQEREADLFSLFSLVPSYLLEVSIADSAGAEDCLLSFLAELYCVPEPFMKERLEIFVAQTLQSNRAYIAEVEQEYVLRSTSDRREEYILEEDGYACRHKRKRKEK